MHSFLLIGQSNMAGRGFLAEAHPIDKTHIYILRNGRWQKMFRPINPDRSSSGVSLAESFAERYAQTYNVDVGLICCADGGTKLSQWMPGQLLYDNAVYQAKLAERTSQIVGVLWHQGESDLHAKLYPTYRPRFERMMQALRKDLELEGVPFIVGGLGDYLAEDMPNYIHVNQALRDIAASHPAVGFAPADGLTSNPDHLHFNAASLYEFGLRYFDAYQALGYTPKAPAQAVPTENLQRTALELL